MGDLARADPDKAAQAAYGAISACQHLSPEDQVLGVAMAFVAISTKSDVLPGDLLNRAERMLKARGQWCAEMRALRSYLQEEVFEKLR